MVSRLSVVTRLVAVFVLAILALIWIGRPVGAVEPAPPMSAKTHPYTYDASKYDFPGAEATSERGPPTECRSCTINDVDRRSHGASPRSDTSPGRSITTYAHRAELVQLARASTTTGGRVGLPDGDSSSFERSSVAAETGGFDLAAAEEAGGHTLARHVGMSDQALIDRNIPYASTFTDQAAAESVTAQNLSSNVGAISKWLAGTSPRLAIQDSMDSGLGRVYERATQSFVQPSGVNTVLVRTPTGYNVLTSYPTP